MAPPVADPELVSAARIFRGGKMPSCIGSFLTASNVKSGLNDGSPQEDVRYDLPRVQKNWDFIKVVDPNGDFTAGMRK